jgi:hypothetical protein
LPTRVVRGSARSRSTARAIARFNELLADVGDAMKELRLVDRRPSDLKAIRAGPHVLKWLVWQADKSTAVPQRS